MVEFFPNDADWNNLAPLKLKFREDAIFNTS